jgi:glucose-1-phosphate adenylyltransferase
MGIGSGTVVTRAIVDKNARIGSGVRILNEAAETHRDGDGYFIRDGIVIVPKDAVIPDGAVI